MIKIVLTKTGWFGRVETKEIVIEPFDVTGNVERITLIEELNQLVSEDDWRIVSITGPMEE